MSLPMSNNFKGFSELFIIFKIYSYLCFPSFYFKNSVAKWPLAGESGFLGLKMTPF
jgi:hypothetical protein